MKWTSEASRTMREFLLICQLTVNSINCIVTSVLGTCIKLRQVDFPVLMSWLGSQVQTSKFLDFQAGRTIPGDITETMVARSRLKRLAQTSARHMEVRFCLGSLLQ